MGSVNTSKPLIEARDLTLSYGRTMALRGVDLQVQPGKVLGLLGRSGSGKTSLLYCLAGILRPDSGTVRFGDVELTSLDDDETSAVRRSSFGFVFQFGELVPELTLADNVALPLWMNDVSKRDARQRVDDILERLGIGPVADKRPGEVSGGQAQRAAIARALVHSPQVVFADEPTGSLDDDNSKIVLEELIGLAKSSRAAVLLVTHERAVAEACDATVEVADGRIVGAHTMATGS
jgi:putative ABC transport system ATP-binding protein